MRRVIMQSLVVVDTHEATVTYADSAAYPGKEGNLLIAIVRWLEKERSRLGLEVCNFARQADTFCTSCDKVSCDGMPCQDVHFLVKATAVCGDGLSMLVLFGAVQRHEMIVCANTVHRMVPGATAVRSHIQARCVGGRAATTWCLVPGWQCTIV
jgi:hypothetical protein